MTVDAANRFLPAAGGSLPAGRVAGRDLSGAVHDLPCPADGTTLARVEWAAAGQVDDAVQAATAAGTEWAAVPPRDRGHALRAIAAALREHSGELGEIICAESGKRMAEATGEVNFSAQYFDWFAEAAAQPRERYFQTPGRRFIMQRRPIGVVAAVSPWNFPLSIPARKVAPALAAGCPVIQKASELTPLSSLALTRLAEPYLPDNVLSLLIGDGTELTTALTEHPGVRAVSFTGSTRVGTQVSTKAMDSMTRVIMELGGKSPFIVCPDADVETAVETLMVAKFRNNGASCLAANNVYVHESLLAKVRDGMIDRIRSMRVGDPSDPATDLGPMLRPEHVDRLNGLVDEAAAVGCAVERGHQGPDQGWYCPPAVVDAEQDLGMWRAEIFGPICPLRGYTDEDAVIAEVHSWQMGLGGYVVGADAEHTANLAAALPIGLMAINNGAPNTPEVPMGGIGLSGIGREGGESGLLEFTEEQTLSFAR